MSADYLDKLKTESTRILHPKTIPASSPVTVPIHSNKEFPGHNYSKLGDPRMGNKSFFLRSGVTLPCLPCSGVTLPCLPCSGVTLPCLPCLETGQFTEKWLDCFYVRTAYRNSHSENPKRIFILKNSKILQYYTHYY